MSKGRSIKKFLSSDSSSGSVSPMTSVMPARKTPMEAKTPFRRKLAPKAGSVRKSGRGGAEEEEEENIVEGGPKYKFSVECGSMEVDERNEFFFLKLMLNDRWNNEATKIAIQG